MPVEVKNIKPGDLLVAGMQFSCIETDARLTVKSGLEGLYVDCVNGRHYLADLTDDDGILFGMERVQ